MNITIEVRCPGSDDALIDSSASALDALAELPGLYGVVTSTDLHERTVAARFDVDDIAAIERAALVMGGLDN